MPVIAIRSQVRPMAPRARTGLSDWPWIRGEPSAHQACSLLLSSHREGARRNDRPRAERYAMPQTAADRISISESVPWNSYAGFEERLK